MNELNLARKQQAVDTITAVLESSRMTVMANFSGITVAEMEQLRRRLKGSQAQLKVVKNSLLKRACERLGK
ncbi:MAG: 50S ribosomal protein L10, partial [Candidatus Omnitrophica bacterium]|nr:50S ribosomal protein L10 [Candidatus Omnitrophota bacterium]